MIRYLEVRLEGVLTVKRMEVPASILGDFVQMNELARKYFRGLGYEKVDVVRWL